MRSGFRIPRLAAAVFQLCLGAALSGSALAQAVLSQQPVRAGQHMVVAANPHAVAAGSEILDAGGSAVDAAIAVDGVERVIDLLEVSKP